MALWRRTSRGKRRKAVAGILAALMLFVMLFTVGTGYFLFVNQNNLLYTQSLSNRAADTQGTLSESVSITTGEGANSHITMVLNNLGPTATTIVEVFVTSPSGALTPVTIQSSPALPITLNPGTGSATIDTSVAYTSGTFTIKVLTQRGAQFAATYPETATALASQALSSGAIGDLYLTFQSYTFYTVTSHSSNANCPAASGSPNYYSGYCLQTSSGNTGNGFFIASNLISTPLGYSLSLTDLNPLQYDIILDQFTLIYQTNTNGHVNLNPWYVANVGPITNGFYPILSIYNPYVLHYNVAQTVFFVATACLAAGSGPNDANCTGSSFGTTDCQVGLISNVFIISNGWEESPGSYTLGGLTYTNGGANGINYGQNTPFVSTLCY